MAWDSSTRAQRLPSDWPRIRRAILARDPVCRSCGVEPSTEVDHIRRGDDHRPTNLQGLCHACHVAKTAVEAREGLVRYWEIRRRTRPPEVHPGTT